MIRALVVLCLIAAPAFGALEKGFTVTFCADPSKFGTECFMPLPENAAEAISDSWRIVNKPRVPRGYEALDLWCPMDERSVCVFFDKHGNLAGLQIALDPDNCYEVIFDWTEAGFTQWENTVNGITTKYWATQQFYVSPKDLAADAPIRTGNSNSDYLIQGDIYVTGFDGELQTIPTDSTEIPNSIYTLQACIFAMGYHYYYNMTSNMECSAKTVSTYFSLDYANQNIGIGFMLPANCKVPVGHKNFFEYPAKAEIQMIVPDAPQCLYDYGDSPGVVTMHTYFIKHPYHITCQ